MAVHPRDHQDICAQTINIDTRRHGVEEHVGRLAEQSDHRAGHQRGDEQRGDRVDPVPRERLQQQAGDEHDGRPGEVAEQVQPRGADGELVVVPASDCKRTPAVDGHADEPDQDHRTARHLGRGEQTMNRLPHHP